MFCTLKLRPICHSHTQTCSSLFVIGQVSRDETDEHTQLLAQSERDRRAQATIRLYEKELADADRRTEKAEETLRDEKAAWEARLATWKREREQYKQVGALSFSYSLFLFSHPLCKCLWTSVFMLN